MEPRDHGLEYEEDVRPQPRLTRPCAAWRRESRRLPVNRGEITTRSGRHQTSGGSWQRQNRPRRSATKPQSDGLLGTFIVPGDMPFLRSNLLKDLMAIFNESVGASIVYPTTLRGEQRSPVLWPRRFFPLLASLSGPGGAKHLLATCINCQKQLPVGDERAFADIDAPVDLETARSHWKK